MDFFKHDLNASDDDKICDLMANGGYEMLGYYWRFVEYLYSRGGKVSKSKIKGIAWSLHMELAKLTSLITDFDLFVDDGENIFSKRIVAEISEFEANGKKFSEAGKRGGKASAKARSQAGVQGGVEATLEGGLEGGVEASLKPRSTIAEQNKIKENKRKENKNNIGFGGAPDAPLGGAPSPALPKMPEVGEEIKYQNARGNTLTFVWREKDTRRFASRKWATIDDYIHEMEQ